MDLLGNEITPGTLVIYPDGAKFRTGIVKKLGKGTAHIIGARDGGYRNGDSIFKKNKALHLCISVNFQQLEAHERREFLRTYSHGFRRLYQHGRRGPENVMDQNVDDYVHGRVKLLSQLQHMITNQPMPEHLIPTKEQEETISNILSGKYTTISIW
jgi:hypothetical protein